MAQSTETLATTTTAAQVNPGDSIVTLASLAGVTTSSFLYIDEELLGVERFGVGNTVVCIRGVEGTATSLHGSYRGAALAAAGAAVHQPAEREVLAAGGG